MHQFINMYFSFKFIVLELSCANQQYVGVSTSDVKWIEKRELAAVACRSWTKSNADMHVRLAFGRHTIAWEHSGIHGQCKTSRPTAKRWREMAKSKSIPSRIDWKSSGHQAQTCCHAQNRIHHTKKIRFPLSFAVLMATTLARERWRRRLSSSWPQLLNYKCYTSSERCAISALINATPKMVSHYIRIFVKFNELIQLGFICFCTRPYRRSIIDINTSDVYGPRTRVYTGARQHSQRTLSVLRAARFRCEQHSCASVFSFPMAWATTRHNHLAYTSTYISHSPVWAYLALRFSLFAHSVWSVKYSYVTTTTKKPYSTAPLSKYNLTTLVAVCRSTSQCPVYWT